MSYEKSAILNQESSIYPLYNNGRFCDKKAESCSLCCVACGGYMYGKTCNVFFDVVDAGFMGNVKFCHKNIFYKFFSYSLIYLN